MKIPLDKFEDWLRNKNLKERTIESYIYYFSKFTFEVFDQESVSRYLSLKSNRNNVARSFLLNFQKFLKVHYKELGISPELKANISEVELPKLTGRIKQRIIRPIPYDQIFLLEKNLETEKEKLQLLFSYFCGLRLGELLKITIISFNWDLWKQDTSKMGECRVFGKGDKEGIALVPQELMKRVAAFIHTENFPSINSYIFRNPNKEYNFNALARQWQYKLADAGVKAGITQITPEGKIIKETAVHPHRLRHCVSEDVQILTLDGWKKHDEIKVGDLAFTYNLKKDKIEVSPIFKIFRYSVNEDIYRIKNKNLDYLCTGNHNGVFKIGYERQTDNVVFTDWKEWNLITLNQLLGIKGIRSVKHKLSSFYDGPDSIGKEKAGIIGWILTDGHINNRKNHIEIFIDQSVLSNKTKCDYIRNLLIAGNIPFTERKHTHGEFIRFRLTNGGNRGNIKGKNHDWIFSYINPDKTPKYTLLSLKREELEELYKCMMLGDGTCRKDGYSCNELTLQDKRVIDFFRSLCCLIGKVTSLGFKKNNLHGYFLDKEKTYFRTYIRDGEECNINFDRKDIKKEHYKGLVWCPSLKNLTWIARSNEKIFITGNSYASHLLNVVGLDIREVQELLRHSSIQSTQIYTHVSTEQLKDKLVDFHS